MVSLEGFQSQLLLGGDALGTHLLDLVGEDLRGGGSRVDTVGLDGDEDATADLEEVVGVHGDDTGLVGLGNIGEDGIDHGHDHAVLQGLTGVLNDGNDVGALGGHADQVATGAGRELDGVDEAGRTDDIGNVGDGSTRGTTEIEDLGAGAEVHPVETTDDTSRKLGAEGVPHAVLDLGVCRGAVLVLDGIVDGDTLLAVDGLAGGQVASSNSVLLAANDEDAGVAMGLLDRGSVLRIVRFPGDELDVPQ